MGKYDLTPSDIQTGVQRVLAEAYSSVTVSNNPKLVYITAGPGAGKTALEVYFKKEFKEKGDKAFIINSDKIAMFHPNYEEALEELPEECYRITRQFVRPATPMIFCELMKNNINIINENTLDKGQPDFDLAREFKEKGYTISVNIVATDLFESRLSCFERDAATLKIGLTPRGCSKETQARMYNSFVPEIQELERLGLCDELNVFVRGENINKPPILKYYKGSQSYRDFNEALSTEREFQRKKLLADPTKYLMRIKEAKDTISTYGINEVLTLNSLNGLDELEKDFIKELGKRRTENQI